MSIAQQGILIGLKPSPQGSTQFIPSSLPNEFGQKRRNKKRLCAANAVLVEALPPGINAVHPLIQPLFKKYCGHEINFSASKIKED
jgi:hypothetical protein